MLAPGSTIGILGGGQLGRMLVGAAARLGYRSHVFTPEAESPAGLVTPFVTRAPFDDEAALARFAAAVDVVTFEFENVPAATAEFITARGKPMHPGPEVLRITQDRLEEKDFLRSVGVATTEYRAVNSLADLRRAAQQIGPRGVLKTVRLGYDGKGQVMLGPDSDLAEAWRRLGGAIAILEGFVDFACEVSVIIARNASGADATYSPVENRHVNHILDTTVAPARIAPEAAIRAEAIARHVADRLGVIGLLAVEMFLTRSGELLVNELAPRPHNSGHWTLDACATSQFEQHVRAICGLPLGSTARHCDAVMKNLIGDEVERWREWIADPSAKVHIYGKSEARPGRKMGHVTRLLPRG
ncbi:MAG TPA: 5-(carboxyamino)imidazole ribonucleotide synthase [Stellaceae bacterium]|nr:5-(carboxyamino)imidazole ribonucleotide synthase [Stellaceae bacterium]